MTLSDWINNIRWKYFTNEKSGLIFKELMKEFRMVEQMTENKRYTSYFDGAIRINEKELVAYAHSEVNARYLCNLLNEQEETIQNQKMEINLLLEEMKEIRDKLTIYLEIKGDVE